MKSYSMKEFQLQPLLLKNNSLNLFRKRKVTGHILMFVALALPLASLSFLNFDAAWKIWAFKVLQLAFFGLLGIRHISLLKNRSVFIHHSEKDKLYFSFVLTLIIYGALLLFYFVVKTNLQHMALSSSCAFLVPYLVNQAWLNYQLIPENNAKVWYDYNPVVENPDIAYLNTIRINLTLSRSFNVKDNVSYLISTPLTLELGKLFNAFLFVETKASTGEIECVNDESVPYGWKFFVVKYGGLYKRALDPDKSLQNNGNIKKNTNLLAKRVISE